MSADKEQRLNQYIAACGVCSRREADRLIGEGRVSVNGAAASIGMKVTAWDEVIVDGKELKGKNKKVTLAYYKPVGVVCTERDAHAERKLKDVLSYPVRVTYAGRLDKESEGLLLMTNDGELIDAMMRGRNGHEKEYVVKVNREVTEEFLRRLEGGVRLEELGITTKPCKAEKTGKYTYNIVLTQGVNRQIRRMSSALGYTVRSIKRTRVMNIFLADLKPGEYREIAGSELEELYRECGLT